MNLRRLSLIEIFLIQVIFYAVIWLADEYVASYLCIILPVITAAVLLVSWIADILEPARVGRRYYQFMILSTITPLLVGLFFYIVYDGKIAWLRESF